ncbi:MAG: ATP-binding protein [Cryobacterium sp.]
MSEAPLPELAPTCSPRRPISRAQIETVIYRSVAGISLVFALQSIPSVLEQVGGRRSEWALLGVVVLGAAILAVLLASIFKRGVRAAAAVVAVIYLVEVLTWPSLTADPDVVLAGTPYIWYLCTVATSCAAIAFSLHWAALYTFVVPIVYGLIRVLPAGGSADAGLAVLDVVYAMLLGQVVLMIIAMLRHATSVVDAAQTKALATYAVAVRHHATEVERIEVDAIVHDTVLATLLAAAGAHTPRNAHLAGVMAANALSRLDEAETVVEPVDEDRLGPFSKLADRIRAAASALSCPVQVHNPVTGPALLPEQAAEALYSATVQAMVNSLQHAGTLPAPGARSVTLSVTDAGACLIEIADQGCGFVLTDVPADRLGLRLSIQGRVSAAGGSALIDSRVGAGTTVTLRWPRDEKPS